MTREKVITLAPTEVREGIFKGRLRGLFENGQLRNLHIRGAANWKKYIPLSRQNAAAILTRDLPPQTQVNITLNKAGRGTMELLAEGLFHYSDTSGDVGASFDLKKEYTSKGRLIVEDERRGHGVGRIVRRNLIEFYRLCGVRVSNIHAGYSGGGYMWARFGDLPDNVESHDFEVQTKKPVNDRYQFLRPLLGDEDVKILDAAVAFRDGHDVWWIADRDRDIGPVLRPLFNTIAAGNTATPEASRLLSLFQTGHGFQVLAHIADSLKAGRKITVGQFLLAGTSWRGHIDLNDPEQMRRAGKYAGGWRYIGFEPAG